MYGSSAWQMMNQLIFHSRLRIIMIITKQPLSLPNSNIKHKTSRHWAWAMKGCI